MNVRSLFPMLATALFGCDASTGSTIPTPEAPASTTRALTTPALSGGTLAVSSDGQFAVVAEPARDRVFVVSLAAREVLFEIETSGEPGRVVVGESEAFVGLRRCGVVRCSPSSSTPVRRGAC